MSRYPIATNTSCYLSYILYALQLATIRMQRNPRGEGEVTSFKKSERIDFYISHLNEGFSLEGAGGGSSLNARSVYGFE